MSERGGNSSRGRGAGRGRGRGRGGQMTWEWENYKPDETVYNSLYHVRRAPPTIVQNLPNECPIPNAQSRIIRRDETDDGYRRHYYVVEVKYNVSSSNARPGGEDEVEILEVGVNQIDQYVSAREQERYETIEARAETQAEVVARRVEAREQERRRLEKNQRASRKGRGRGGRSLHGIGPDLDDESASSSARGRRGTGRGRGRGRASKRGRGGTVAFVQITAKEEAEDVDPVAPVDNKVSENEEEAIRRTIADSEEESSGGHPAKLASPDLARSSFVANSALPVSPVASHRVSRPGEILREMSDEDELPDNRPRSMSSAAEQLHSERRDRRQPTYEDEHLIPDRDFHRGHLAKKQRTASSTSFRQAPTPATKKIAAPARSNSRFKVSRHVSANKEDHRRLGCLANKQRPGTAISTKKKVEVVESSESSESSSESESETESSEASEASETAEPAITVHVPERKSKPKPTRGGKTPSDPARGSQYGGSRAPSTNRYNSNQPARSSTKGHNRVIVPVHPPQPERSRDFYRYMEKDMDDEDDDYDDDAERGVDLDDDNDEDDDEDEGAEEYVVEKILNHNFESGLKYYLVKWEGYENSDWMEEKDLGGAKEVLDDYHKRVNIRKGKQPMR